MLLSGERFRTQLEKNLNKSRRFFCYSAFFTNPAAVWLEKKRIILDTDRLLIRALPVDFITGACSFEAIKKVLSRNMAVKMSSALHAKVYAFDDCVYAGSSNLTAKGLALCEDHNQELGVRSELNDQDLSLLDHLWSQASNINYEITEKMEDFVGQISHSSSDDATKPLTWPTDIISETRDLYCSDFPQTYPSNDFRWSTESALKQSLAYKWLSATVKKNGESRFGFLSYNLHNTIYDDPTPYRREIKTLLANLLSAVSDLDSNKLEIIRPNYTQVVRLRKSK